MMAVRQRIQQMIPLIIHQIQTTMAQMQITYEICDANGDCDPATINITVDPVNDVPVADDDSETTDEDTPVNIVY
jgi:hypothetical protein